MDSHAAVGGESGLSREQIEVALEMRDPAELPRREQLVVEYADRVSATPVDVSDEFFAELAGEFSEEEIVELTAHIAQENYNAKSNRPLRVGANDFCELPIPDVDARKK